MPKTNLITIDGVTKPLKDWLAQFNRQRETYYSRLRQGWTVEQAIKTPLIRNAGRPASGFASDAVLPRRDTKGGPLNSRSGVYAVKNTQTGKCYIGHAADLNQRRRMWRQALLGKDGPLLQQLPEIQQDVEAHGAESFEFYVLKFMPGSTRKERKELEVNLIRALRADDPDAAYNPYPDNAVLGRKRAAEEEQFFAPLIIDGEAHSFADWLDAWLNDNDDGWLNVLNELES